ncbi:MAG: hypothetical protein ACRC6U_08860 [Fusobacteriaceae bacterium]
MADVYITKSNLNRLVRSFKIQRANFNFNIKDIGHGLDNCCLFSTFEKNQILLSKNIIQDQESFLSNNKNILIKNESEKNYEYKIFKSSPPAYHKNSECDRLNNDYENYIIDEKLPKEKINEYREWFKKHILLFEGGNKEALNFKIFLKKHNEKWGVELEIPIHENKKNSGTETINLDRIVEIKKEIIEICRVVDAKDKKFFKTKLKQSYIAEKNDSKEIKNLYIKKYTKELKEIHKKKQEIIKILIQFFLDKTTKDKRYFSKNILEIAGFKACRCCNNYENVL